MPRFTKRSFSPKDDSSLLFQNNQVSPFVQPPFEHTISRDERGPHDNLKEKEYVGDSYGSSEEVTKRDTQTQPDHLRPHESAKMVCEVTKNMAGDEQNKIEHSDEPDSKKTDTWDFTMLTHDEKDCLYVEVRNIDGAVNFRTLSKIIQKSQIPIRIPNLIYPFENKQKALLICQTQEDAELLDGYKHEESKLMFEKFKPQCLQKIKIAIPEKSINCLRENGQLENCLQHLEEIGVVEHPEPNYLPATSVFVTVFTMPQVQILLDILQVYNNTRYEKPRPITSSLVDTQKKYLRSDDLGLQNNENKSSSKSDAVHVETIGNVSELSWKVFCKQRSCEIEKLKEQNIYIYFSKDCIYIYGHTDESSIDKIKKDFDKLTKLQFEEIKPVKEGREAEYVQWCSDASDAVGKECCIYDEERKSFIAFGEDYDNIVKIKHQLNIKQDVIKQTGRRRHRHFDTSPKLPDTDSGLSHESSALESMSFAKQKSLDFSWTKDVSQKQEYTTNEGIKVYVYVADILRLPVDCIVNAANSTLKHGGGVAFAIAKAAGQKLTDDGDEYISSNGPVPVGMACTTTAGNLPYACVIHAVGPRWSDYSPYNVINIKDCESHLQNAILSSFSEAEKKKLKSIALPAVSSAIFAVPEDMCAVQYAKAILNYSSGSSIKSDILKEIHFVDKNPNIIRLIQDTFKTMIEDNKTTDYDKMKYVTDKNTINRDLPGFVESPDGCEIIAKNGSKVYFYHGSILEAYRKRISCIVCANDHSGRGLGELANGLARRAQGFEYHKYKSAAFQKVKHVRAGQVVVSTGQGTGYMTVIHAVLWSPEPVADQRVVIQRVYQNVFSEIASRQLSNAAMPPLKTESVSLEHSIEAFIDAYLDFCSTSKSVRKLDIHFVCKSNAENNLAVDLMRTRLQKDDILPDPFRNKSEVYSPDPVDEKEEMKTLDNSCVICMDKISVPKSLPCGHVFCTGCIDNYHENYKQVCPTCGKVCGIIIGDQPDGKMYVVTQRYFHCAGYENNGRIDVTYTFPGGRQKEIHPEPGKYYSGISRTAYLPDNKEGREILELLHIAFERKLIFTIGRSRTTGKEGVITWNDIHHKTNPNPHTTFGYPDPGYFERVRNELADKGVTVNDIENEHQHKGRSDMTQEYESKNKRNI